MGDPEDSNVASPPATAQFLEVAQEIAQALGEDVNKLAHGQSVKYKDKKLSFCLKQHGLYDIEGFVLATDICPLVPGGEAQACKDLLKYNFVSPAGVCGYYALRPEDDFIVFCMRIDFEKDLNPAQVALEFLDKVAMGADQFNEIIEGQAARATRNEMAPFHKA